jgi:hypothetical protein
MSTIEFLIKLKELNVFIHKNEEKLAVKGDRKALTAQLKDQLRASKDDILKTYHKLAIQSNKQLAPTTFAQQRLWIIDQLAGASAHYNMPGQVALAGVDVNVLNKVFSTIIARHQSLRTSFYNDNGLPYQVISPVTDITIPIVSLNHLTAGQKKQEITQRIEKESNLPFNLSKDLMLRVSLLEISEYQTIMLYTIKFFA